MLRLRVGSIFLTRIRGNRTEGWIEISLTGKSGKCSVVRIINRDGRMISKNISFRSSFPFIRGYAASVRIARC